MARVDLSIPFDILMMITRFYLRDFFLYVIIFDVCLHTPRIQVPAEQQNVEFPKLSGTVGRMYSNSGPSSPVCRCQIPAFHWQILSFCPRKCIFVLIGCALRSGLSTATAYLGTSTLVSQHDNQLLTSTLRIICVETACHLLAGIQFGLLVLDISCV